MLSATNRKQTSPVPRIPFYIPLFNYVVRSFLRIGMPMGYVGLLGVKGRTTGKTRRNPVGLFKFKGRQYLFSTFGDVNWVRNLRAAKYATIRRGWHTRRVIPTELSPTETAEVLKGAISPAFLGLGGKIFGSHFPLKPHASIDEFVAEAGRHPVFELRDAD